MRSASWAVVIDPSTSDRSYGPSTTALVASPSPAPLGSTVNLTATVTGTNPSGTVTFKDGTTTLGSATLASGSATLSTPFTSLGSHSLTAVYAGDTNNTASMSQRPVWVRRSSAWPTSAGEGKS